MKEVCEPYMENLQPFTGNSFIGFSETASTKNIEPVPDEMFRSADQSFTHTKKSNSHRPVLPVNNYLKTAEEIEVEFLFMMNSAKIEIDEKEDLWNTYDFLIERKSVSMTAIHNPNKVLSNSIMEENY